MVRVLSGPNSFALKQALKRLKTEFIKEHGDLALETIDGEEADFGQVISAVESVSLLAPKKLVIVYSLSTTKEASERIEELIKAADQDNELIIVEPKVDRRSTYYKYLKKNTEFEEFSEPDDRQLSAWSVEYAKGLGAKLSFADANYLVQRVGVNQEIVSNELKKLADYDNNISRETIDILTESNPQTTIFNLIDAAFSGDFKTALQIYDEQRTQGDEPLKIFGMIIWQIHLIALAASAEGKSDSEVMQASGLKPFTLNKSRSIARKMGSIRIKEMLAKLVEVDRQMKSSLVDADDALKSLLVSLA